MALEENKDLTEANLEIFLEEVIVRGIGIYGMEQMAVICYKSDIGLLDDYTVAWLTSDHDDAIKRLIENYAHINLPAKMTIMVLSKKHNIPIPDSLLAKKSKFRFLKFVRK